MKRGALRAGLVLASLVVLLAPLGGCPAPTDGTDDTTTTPTLSTLTAHKTTIPVHYAASLQVGDDLVVFGTGAVAGVSFFVPSQGTVNTYALPGTPRSAGLAVAGKKVLTFAADALLSVYDTSTGVATAIPGTEITLDTLPSDSGDDLVSPVIADGHLAVTRNSSSAVGKMLKVVDVSGTTPVITPLNNLRDNLQLGGRQVVISATDHVVITFADDSFFIYDLNTATADPREIKLGEKDGISGPFAYGGGTILYVSRKTALQNFRMLSLSDTTETPSVFTKNPGDRDKPFALQNGRYVYFLNRNAYDSWAESAVSSDIVYRTARGAVSSLSPTEGGTAGANPDSSSTPWFGYGGRAVVTPNGTYAFVSGEQSVNVQTEILQVATTGNFQVFADGTGYLAATDVVAGDKLVAFKTGTSTNTVLGYIVLP